MEVTPHTSNNQFDLYASPNTASKPLIIFVHGGAWRSENKAMHACLAHRIRDLIGFPVALLEYRLSTPEHNNIQHPEHCVDVFAALKSLMSWSGTPVFDKTRLYIVGHSAGGHILASIFLDSGIEQIKPDERILEAVQGIAVASGIFDLDALLAKFPSYDFIAQAFSSPFDKWNTTRYPLHQSMTSTRWRVIHSRGDELIDLAQSDAMYQHLTNLCASRGLDQDLVTKDYDTLTTGHYYPEEPIFAKLVADWVEADLRDYKK